MAQRITVAYGDGIGPEIMMATLDILRSAGAQLDIDIIEVGQKVYEQGFTSGIRPDDWKTIEQNRVLLKAPITTPQGGGYKSLNVTIRKTLGLFANVRPVRAYAPFIATRHPAMNLVIIRENEEDLYAGIEHRQTQDVYQCLKLITRTGSERIVRYAFEYARHSGRRKVTCMTKDNIMKLTDGLFHQVFDEVAREYPEIESRHQIIDIGAARLADTPEDYDVIVLPNLYGDIVSDIAAQISGSVGLAGSSNIGQRCAMFEAIHGSAPDIAGENKANPSGLLMAAVMMLNHIGEGVIAQRIENAWLRTIEDGVRTADIALPGDEVAGTTQFTEALIERLGSKPGHLACAPVISSGLEWDCVPRTRPVQKKRFKGMDVFLEWQGSNVNELGDNLKKAAAGTHYELFMITNRGIKVYPNGNTNTYCTDHWRCRFMSDEDDQKNMTALLAGILEQGLEVIKTEGLYSFDGEPGFSLGQGQ